MSTENAEFLKCKVKQPVEAYFSESYDEAREKFKTVVASLALETEVRLESLKVVEPDYFMDIAVIEGKTSNGLMVHSCGVHGVEGYAGSAIQISQLHDMLCNGTRPDTTCVFIHAVNPYGMRHFRRTNENNVDLNRNALSDDEWKEVLARDSNIAGYEDIKDMVVASSAPSPWSVYAGIWLQAAGKLSRHGLQHLKKALVSGTYTHEKGVFFGGKRLEPSHELLVEWISKNFGHVPGSEVMWIDVHTGLGPKGVDVLMAADKQAHEEICGQFTNVECQRTDAADNMETKNQSAGYDLVRGLLGNHYWRCFGSLGDESARAMIIVQEFGTSPPIHVIRNMIIENRGYHFDPDNRDYWSTYTRDVFYVRQREWKVSIATRGKIVFEEALELCKKRCKK